VLTRQPASVTVTSETRCGGYSNVVTSRGTFPVPVRKGEVARTREGDWQSFVSTLSG
jgi:hypothetical protein